jgi:hypothetical protein
VGVYLYRINRRPFTAMDGAPVHRLMFSRKLSGGDLDLVRADERAAEAIRRSWQEGGPKDSSLLVTYRGTGPIFRMDRPWGGYYDTDGLPVVGRLLKVRGRHRAVSVVEEAQLWASIGAWWRSSAQALSETAHGYRPTIRINEPGGEILAALYDAEAKARGDSRRAFLSRA